MCKEIDHSLKTVPVNILFNLYFSVGYYRGHYQLASSG